MHPNTMHLNVTNKVHDIDLVKFSTVRNTIQTIACLVVFVPRNSGFLLFDSFFGAFCG